MRLVTRRRQQRWILAARRRRIRILQRAALLSVLLAVFGCSGKLVALDRENGGGRFRHRELGYEIDFPSVLGEPGWSRGSLEGSDLIVVHRDGSTWTLASHCRRTATPVPLLAAALARAARDGDGGRPEGESVQQAGLEGWAQRLETSADGGAWVIKTVTLRGARCVYDWILLAPTRRQLEDLEPRFDGWWRSFRPGAGEIVAREDPGESPGESSGDSPDESSGDSPEESPDDSGDGLAEGLGEGGA